MRLIWTKSSLPLSVFIRAVTGEPTSHFAFVFESAAKGLMFESNLLGTRPRFYANAKKHFTEVYAKDLTLPIDLEDIIWDMVVEKYDDKPYDYGGALYLGVAKLKHRILSIPIPASNAWASSDKFYCEEIVSVLSIIPGFPKLESVDMKTPEDLWDILKDWNYA